MQVIVSHAEDKWRYWLKLEGRRVFSGKTREIAPIDLRKIKWSPSSLKKVQKTQAGLYDKLVRAKTELERHFLVDDSERMAGERSPLTLAWSDLD